MGSRYVVTLDIVAPDHRRADLDNICKAHLDALNGLAWKDDSQVDSLRITRRVDKSDPGVRVCVSVLEDK
jgi:Holliday junction resolvase RusA-like endonuclease